MKQPKAVVLFSGGLDSSLTVKLLLEQKIKVIAFYFNILFNSIKEEDKAVDAAKQLNVPLKIVKADTKYFNVIRNPKHGYGKNMNPCLDCKSFILKKAKQYAKKIKADFIATGEVLNERPMSQNKRAFEIIEKESGLKNKILRPLSAKLLPETEAEKKGFVDRNKLLDINGRPRKKQFELAKKFKLSYPTPAGGCLLTQKEFAVKAKDLFKHKKRITEDDIELLKIGRHFRFNKNKIIVGRNENENNALIKLKPKADYFFEVKGIGSPISLLQGKKTKKAIEKAASLTAYYSDNKEKKVEVSYGKNKLNKLIIVEKAVDVEKLRVKS